MIAAFDLATKTGLAWGNPGERPSWDMWDLKHGRTVGARGYAFMKRYTKFVDTVKPDKIYIEEPLSPHVMDLIGATADTNIFLVGIVFLALTISHARQIPTERIEVQDVRGHFTGRRRYKDRDQAKKATIARCIQLGWRVEGDDNVADACALWDYACARVGGSTWAEVHARAPLRSALK